jgi:hypothetical protein
MTNDSAFMELAPPHAADRAELVSAFIDAVVRDDGSGIDAASLLISVLPAPPSRESQWWLGYTNRRDKLSSETPCPRAAPSPWPRGRSHRVVATPILGGLLNKYYLAHRAAGYQETQRASFLWITGGRGSGGPSRAPCAAPHRSRLGLPRQVSQFQFCFKET